MYSQSIKPGLDYIKSIIYTWENCAYYKTFVIVLIFIFKLEPRKFNIYILFILKSLTRGISLICTKHNNCQRIDL